MEDNRASAFQRFNNWHFIYIIIILVMIILLVITHRGYSCSNLVTVISFGATLSSIILSVLAIFLSFVSNESNHRLRDGLRGLGELPNEIRKSINETITNLKDETSKIRSATQQNLESQLKSNDVVRESLDSFVNSISHHYEDYTNTIKGVHDDLILKMEEIRNTHVDSEISLSEEQLTSFIFSLPKFLKTFICAVDELNQMKIYNVDLSKYVDCLGYKEFPELGMYLLSSLTMLRSLNLLDFAETKLTPSYLVNLKSVEKSFHDYLTKSVVKSLDASDIDVKKRFVKESNDRGDALSNG